MGKRKNIFRRIYLRAVVELYFYFLNRNFKKYFSKDDTKKNAIMLAGYSRSGTTLVRLIWLNSINCIDPRWDEIDFVVVENEMPYENVFADLKKNWTHKALPCLVKVHNSFGERHKGFRAVHIFRNPLDSMVACYEYQKRKVKRSGGHDITWIEKRFLEAFVGNDYPSFSDYLRAHFDSYCSHFRSWMKEGSIPLSYESLQGDTASESINFVLENLGLKIDREIIEKAVLLSGKDRMKKKPMSDKMATLDGRGFIRTRYVGEWREYFSKEDLDFVKQRLACHGLDKKEMFLEGYRDLLSEWPLED